MNKLLLIVLTITLISCGKDNGSGSDIDTTSNFLQCEMPKEYVGMWFGTGRNETLEFNTNCTFKNSYCSAVGTIQPKKNEKDVYLIHILTTDATLDECTPRGVYVCAIKLESKYLTTNCTGIGLSTYQQ